MDDHSPNFAEDQPFRCWCGHARLEGFSPHYWRCPECQTLVRRGEGNAPAGDVDGDHDSTPHLPPDGGSPDPETRARFDLPERCLHWLQTLLKFVPGPGARTLELGCGHGGFVAMQRWAGLDATGLELNPWLVGRAREWFGVPVLEGRLEDQDLAAPSFDAVVLLDVLQQLPTPRDTLARAVSLLRSSTGFLLIQTPSYPAGVSYESLGAANHPLLARLRRREYPYFFSEQAVRRLCAESGVGEVRFEPALAADRDLFAVGSAGPLAERSGSERAGLLMAASPPARWTQALLDLGEVRDALATRLAATAAESSTLRQTLESQRSEIARLHTEVDHGSQELLAVRPQLDAALDERNSLAAQLDDLRGDLARARNDRTASLETVADQGARLDSLQQQIATWESRFAADETHQARMASEAQRTLATHARLQTQLLATEREHSRISGDLTVFQTKHVALTRDLTEERSARASLESELATARERQGVLEAHWTVRMLKKLGLWPL